MIRVYFTMTDGDGSLMAHRLLEHALAEDWGITDAQYGRTDKGKPIITNHLRTFISLTHTRGAVAVAVSDHPVGIDAEAVGEIRPRVMENMFTEGEKEYVGDDPLRFCRVWTRKESYGKLTGTGLLRRMNTMDVLTGVEAHFTPFDVEGTVAVVCSYGEDSVTVRQISEDILKG